MKPINGMGDGEPFEECEGCGREWKGHTAHLVRWDGDWGWVCDYCYAERPPQVIA